MKQLIDSMAENARYRKALHAIVKDDGKRTTPDELARVRATAQKALDNE
jgi:hypothetical protein